MARRGYTRVRRCAEEGCREVSHVHYEYKRDWADAVRREAGQPPWKCLKHDKPDVVLSPTNRERTGVLLCEQKDYGRFWKEDGRTGSGFVSGAGFRAWADDFPPGTELIITVQAVLPEDYQPPEPPPAPPLPSLAERFGAQDLDR
ncbi:hypothetical protein HGK72_26805 [Mycolicibacterium fortuitum]|uniref:hypothetical protein n=1 Tax=Mycolicibacterium fortuitum TaxID=1766 RepID=UPI00148FFCA6|nr:hypothetical protein [Mycolicibacterium fortuitum]